MQPEIKARLETTIGNTYNYKGKNITIEKYKVVGVVNVVIFTPAPINFLASDIEDFLDNLHDAVKREVGPAEVFIPESKLVSFEPTRENKIIKETLLATMLKLQTDPGYLAQAKAICEVTSVMVDVQKNEIQMLTVINKMK